MRTSKAQPGNVFLAWDGRNDLGDVVADEAYSLRIRLDNGAGVQRYAPVALPTVAEVSGSSYDRATGILRYELPKSSRVRITAGIESRQPDGKEKIRIPLKTLVADEPRAAGVVIQQWNGYDGSAYVPNLPGFACWIERVDLPENAIITVGNRATKRITDQSQTTSTVPGNPR